jgi:hypothetical protein
MDGLLRDTDRFTPTPGLLSTDLEGEFVLLDPASRQMFSLNATGRVVWRAIPDHDVNGLVQCVTVAFAVGHARALEDVRSLLEGLLDAGLISSLGDDAQR